MTVPLLYGGCDLGALVVSCPKAGAWDELARKLLMDFGLQISQALYTRATQQQLAAGGDWGAGSIGAVQMGLPYGLGLLSLFPPSCGASPCVNCPVTFLT